MTICRVDGCEIGASFNIEGEKKRLYCSNHKADGMVDVRNKKCLHNGCEITPKFNIKGEKMTNLDPEGSCTFKKLLSFIIASLALL